MSALKLLRWAVITIFFSALLTACAAPQPAADTTVVETVIVRETIKETVVVQSTPEVQIVEVTTEPLVPIKLTTGWVHAGGSSAALMLADEKGFFKEEGVMVDVVRGFGSADVVTKVAAGTYEAGTGYFPDLVSTKSETPDFDAIAVLVVYDGDPNALTGVNKELIKTPQDIAGKKISAVAGSTAELLFPIYAEAIGIDPATVEFINVSRELVPIMVQQGDADLSTGFVSTAASNFARLGYEFDDLVMFKYSDILPIYGNALIVRKSWAEKYPDAVSGLVRGYIRGLLYAYQHPEEAIDILVAREPLLDQEIEMNDLLLAEEHYYFTDRVLENGIGYHTTEDIETFIDLIVKGFNLENTPSVADVYDPQFLPPMEERMVSP